MANQIQYLTAVVNLDGNIADQCVIANEWYCDEDCIINGVATLFENYWCQHPVLPNVLIGEPNELEPGHVFIAEVTDSAVLEPRPYTIICEHCSAILSASVDELP